MMFRLTTDIYNKLYLGLSINVVKYKTILTKYIYVSSEQSICGLGNKHLL